MVKNVYLTDIFLDLNEAILSLWINKWGYFRGSI